MCGIAGLLQVDPRKGEGVEARVRAMMDPLRHRGPDDDGWWSDSRVGVALSHRRLSILDLSAAGRQPMHSGSGRFVITYNGEVYNYRSLRGELAGRGHSFRSDTDTEVLLAAVEEWGVEEAVSRADGMFAFGLWDRSAGRLHLVRDRMGIKPLFYGRVDDALVFGSELKAVRAAASRTPDIDRGALALFLRHGYVPAPHSIFVGLRKLPPGHMLTVDAGADEFPDPTSYWSLRRVAEEGTRDRLDCSEEEAARRLEEILLDAVQSRTVSDVPLGAFLSGGIDSSTIVALLQSVTEEAVRTFTIGFEESGYDEAAHARDVAEHLGTEHTELYVTPADARAVIPKLPEMYDEPFADSSQIPTYLVSRLARQDVTVALSGDGGDEHFGGYNRYFRTLDTWRKIGWLPGSVRRSAGHGLQRVSQIMGRVPIRRGRELPRRLADVLEAAGPVDVYHWLVSRWKHPEEVVINGREPPTPLTEASRRAALESFTESMMYLDAVTYLPDDILTKVDRASMAVSLEARVPLLDRRVVEFAWRLPLGMKVRNGTGKRILRRVLHRYVPRCLVDRPKMGFGVPVDAWLRGPLQEWAEELLDEERLYDQGYFRPEPVRKKWREHLRGDEDWQYLLWEVLMFQAWLEDQ